MTDFYTVLRSALDRVGAADSGQRDRVYAHVREVMVRKLRNHRPPIAEAEIDSRLSTFDAAIDRIETEVADEQQADDEAREAQPQRERRYAGRSEPAATHDDYEDEPPAAPEPEPDEVEDAGPLPAWDAPAPQPMWGSPAIDMAWDEGSAQWHDARQFAAAKPFGEASAPLAAELDDAGTRPVKRGLFRRRRNDERVEPSARPEPEIDADLRDGSDGVDGAQAAPAGRRGMFRMRRGAPRQRPGSAAYDDMLPEPEADEAPSRRANAAERRQEFARPQDRLGRSHRRTRQPVRRAWCRRRACRANVAGAAHDPTGKGAGWAGALSAKPRSGCVCRRRRAASAAPPARFGPEAAP